MIYIQQTAIKIMAIFSVSKNQHENEYFRLFPLISHFSIFFSPRNICSNRNFLSLYYSEKCQKVFFSFSPKKVDLYPRNWVATDKVPPSCSLYAFYLVLFIIFVNTIPILSSVSLYCFRQFYTFGLHFHVYNMWYAGIYVKSPL